MGVSKTSPKVAKGHQLAEMVVNLRARGLTLDQIAREIGHKNKSSVYRILAKALKTTPVESVTELRTLETAKLDRIERRLDGFIENKDDPEVSLEAMRVLVRVMERRARLMGIDAPAKTEITGKLTRSYSDEDLETMPLDQLAEVFAVSKSAEKRTKA